MSSSASFVNAAGLLVEEEKEIQYRVVSNDGVEYRMPAKALAMSVALSDCVVSLGYSAEKIESSDPIPLNKVNAKTFEHILKYCIHHKNDPKYEELDRQAAARRLREMQISDWDKEFLASLKPVELFWVIEGANFLYIRMLLDVSCKTVAEMMKGKSAAQMRESFDLESPAEKEKREKLKEAVVVEKEAVKAE